MSDPLDPVAAGVASLLESLRTRTGLQEERLSGTELPLDTLTGLDRVRAFMASGDLPEQAIVRAIRVPASSLEPTLTSWPSEPQPGTFRGGHPGPARPLRPRCGTSP